MKKIILVAAVLLSCISASAQFGIVGGITSSSATLKAAWGDVKSKNITLYHAGITYKIGIGNMFAIQPSLLYNVKGAKISDVEGTESFDLKTGFIELPVQLQLGFSIGSILRIYGLGEPFIGYALTNSAGNESTTVKSWDYYKSRMEYGVNAGAGVELFKHVQVSVKYCWNIGNLYDFSWDATLESVKGNCNSISASIAVIF